MLPLTRSRNRARFFGTPFSPEALFAGGTVAGAWYDPSDLTTLFTTSAGTTQCAMPGGGAAVSVGRMLDKSGNGNHAIAFNDTTARPELRARVNLLEYSEQFDNGYWTKQGGTATKNVIAAPDGAVTGNSFVASAGTANHWMFRAANVLVGQKVAVFAKAGSGASWLNIGFGNGGTTDGAFFDLANGVVGTVASGLTASISKDASTGWCLCVVNTVGAGARNYVSFEIHTADNQALNWNATGGETIYIWGADLRPANIGANVPAYQRIADANTYDTSGFPLYLRFDGIDDSMYTPANVNLSGTDKATVFAGVRKLSAFTGFVAETSAAAESNNGAFRIGTDSGGIEYFISSRGTTSQQVNLDNAAYTSPVTNVVQSSFDIAAPLVSVRINGTAVGSNSGSQGTGNFGTYPLYVGSRNNASFRFNGHLHSLIIAGSAVSAGNISATEQWVAGKVGLVIP